jgi:hypothetical protein
MGATWTIPLEEVEFQGGPLIFREMLAQAIQQISGSQFVNERARVPE